MKKIIFTVAAVLSVTSAITLHSCKKMDATQPQHIEQSANTAFNVSASNNRLVFNTIADYEKVVTNPTPQTQKAFLATINNFNSFTSFATEQNITANLRSDKRMQSLADDDFFKYMLNSDLCIQIGKHIFRVNPVTEKVYALPVANADQYNDLVNENTSNANIQVFSTGDDVLDLIENGEASRKKCKESGIAGEDQSTGVIKIDNNGEFRMEGEIHYNKFGLHFSLFAEVETYSSGVVELTIDLAPLYYHVKCDETVGPQHIYGHGANDLFKYKKYQSYQGMKPLNKVNFRAMFHGTITLPNGTKFTKDAPDWLIIRKNC